MRDELARGAGPMRRCLLPRRRRESIEVLRAHLLALSPGEHALTRRFRPAVDRAFSVKGRGWW